MDLLNKILDEKGVEGLIKFLTDLDKGCKDYQKGLFDKYGEQQVRNWFEW